jgi:hypothetical protein
MRRIMMESQESQVSKHHDPGAELHTEVQARQRNTTWPDAMVNSKSVDELIFKGSPKATKVQRVGIAIIGGTYLLAGLGIMMIASEQHSRISGFVSIVALAVGIRIIWNAVRSPMVTPRAHHPHRLD